jgi:hypothetical protein
VTDVTHKTGEHMKGRANPPKIPDVELLPCPAAEGNHSITHTSDRRAACVHCKVSWIDLDEQVRVAAREGRIVRGMLVERSPR